MNTDEHRFPLKEETHRLIGCALEVINTLGHGLLEKPYENALVVEFRSQGIPFQQQPRYPVRYKSVEVGIYVPDLIAFGQIIVETKTIDQITNIERGQVINYLRITGLHLGVILNFKHPRLQWERIAL